MFSPRNNKEQEYKISRPRRPNGREAGSLRVALFTAVESWSGVEVHTIQLAGVLKKRGHEVVIFEFGRHGYAEAPLSVPCPVIHLDLGQTSSEGRPFEILGFRAWLRIFNPLQVEVAIFAKGTFKFGSLSMEAAARLGFPCFLVIEHMHAPLSKRGKNRCFKGLLPSLGLWWYREKLSGFLRSVFPSKVVCVSRAVASTLAEDYGYSPSKLEVVHSGVDTTQFAPDPSLRIHARETWGIPETAFVFGTVGRLSPMKNIGQLIRTFSSLYELARGRDVRLVIVGDGPLRNSLETLINSSHVRERIVFGGFSKSPEKVYPAFDVFCLPSCGEALGLSLLEAMSCGCPAIAAAVGGVPEILDNSQVGWLIPPLDDQALLSAMQSAMELEFEKFQQLGTNARDHVIRNFNAADRWAEMARVIESTV